MKLTNKLVAEITQFMDLYWDSYLGGNIEKWSTFISAEYKNIDTDLEEIWNSKQDILGYTNAIIDQMANKAEIRNKKTKIIPYDPYIMVHEFGDMYVIVEDNWVFYAQLRLSSLIQKGHHGWSVLHQHFSFSDSRTEVGEAFAVNALKAENKKLLAAVKKRTEELEWKNKELEIETALERVRAVTLGIQEAEDLLKICQVLYKELEGLGFVELRNTMVNLNNDRASLLYNYDYSGKLGGEVTAISYDSHPSTRNIVNKLKKSSNAFGQFAITGKKLEEWRNYRKGLGEKDDPKLKSTKKLSYYFYSVGTASIGISTYKPISKEQLALLERFRNVFELADEYLRLSFHGLWSKDKSFNADFRLALDPSLPKVEVIPQDIGRVLLNLINNAFFAVGLPAKKTGQKLKTKEKIFQPFFTTKPTGEGTGLGLSMSYDIITKGHGEELKVESKEGDGSKFILSIPNKSF